MIAFAAPVPEPVAEAAASEPASLLSMILIFGGVGIVLIIALWIGAGYLWNNRYRPVRLKQGVPTPAFNSILGRVLKLIFVEDRYPLFPMKSAALSKILVWRHYYFGLFVAAVACIFLSAPLGYTGALIGVLFLSIALRTRKVLVARHSIFIRMFEVAASEFGYDKNARLNPWRMVHVKQWDDLTIPGTTQVSFPAAWQSEDFKKRLGFERHFDGTVTDDNAWAYRWNTSKGVVLCEPQQHIPDVAPYPGSGKHPWNEIPLGVGIDGEIVWDVKFAPHILVCGPTGSGKSVLQRMIFFHILQHRDMWQFIGIDPKRVELKPYAKYKEVVTGIATDLADGVELLEWVKDEMERRYKEMEDLGINHFQDLPVKQKAILAMVDETFMFLALEGNKNDEGKERDEMHARASVLIGEIARLGRAAGIHLVLATQRPDATVLKGELKNNLDARIAAGRMATTPSLMVLDTDSAARLPKQRGRGIFSITGEETIYQGYFAEQKWADDYLAKQAGKSADKTENFVGGGQMTLPAIDEPKTSLKKEKKGGLLGKLNSFNAKHAPDTASEAGEDDPDEYEDMLDVVDTSEEASEEDVDTDADMTNDDMDDMDEEYEETELDIAPKSQPPAKPSSVDHVSDDDDLLDEFDVNEPLPSSRRGDDDVDLLFGDLDGFDEEEAPQPTKLSKPAPVPKPSAAKSVTAPPKSVPRSGASATTASPSPAKTAPAEKKVALPTAPTPRTPAPAPAPAPAPSGSISTTVRKLPPRPTRPVRPASPAS